MNEDLVKKIEKYSREIKDETISIRRALHQIPELGDDLPKTRSFILNELRKYDVEVLENVGNNGIIAILRGFKLRCKWDDFSLKQSNQMLWSI